MNWYSQEDNLLRRYLLDDLTAEERRLVEDKLLGGDPGDAPSPTASEEEPDFVDRLLMAEDELIDDYACDALSPREREFFEAGFLSTAERRQKLELARELVGYVAANGETVATIQPQRIADRFAEGDGRRGIQSSATTDRWRSWSLPGWRLAAYAVLAVGVGFGIWLWRGSEPDIGTAMAALNQAYGEERLVKTRVTGLDHAPFKEERGDENPQVNVNARNRAERLLLDAVAEKPSSKAHHALGRFYLARKDFDQAISELEAALKDAPDSAQLHSDLGAALFEKSKLEAREKNAEISPAMLNRSLGHLNRALELDDSLLPALFNRALLRQRVGLLPLAKEDWEKYLQRDANSAWSEEARIQLRQIEDRMKKVSLKEERLLEDFRQAYQSGDQDAVWRVYSQSHWRQGNYVADNLIDGFLEARLANQPAEAQERLQALFYVGDVAQNKSGDQYVAELERFYRNLPPARMPSLAQARGLMKSAYDLSFNRSQERLGGQAYEQAGRVFAQHRNHGEFLLARLWLGVCHFRQSDLQKGRAEINAVLGESEHRGYKWLQALALNSLANVQQRANEYSNAIDSSQRANRIADEIADDNGRLRSLNLTAILYSSLGKYQEAWRVAQKGIELAGQVAAEPSQVIGFYSVTARSFNALGLDAMAIDCSQETLRLGKAMNSPPLVMSRYEVNLGLVYAKLKQYDKAITHIRRGLEIGKSVQPEESGREMTAYALICLGQIHRLSGELDESLDSINEAAEFGQQKKADWLLHRVAKERLLTLLAQKQIPAAEAELQRVLQFYEDNRAGILEESNRNSFFDQEQSIYDVAIDFAASELEDPAQAFLYSESSRARSLLDSFGGNRQLATDGNRPDLRFSGSTEPMSLAEIRERMPENAQLIQYAALEDKLLIWVISKQGIQSRSVQTPARQLTELVTEYLNRLSGSQRADKQRLTRLANELYGILFEPVVSLLDPKKLVCVVPDKVLNFLPCGALVAPKTGKYLIEDYLLTYAPSASLFILYTETARRKAATKQERVLSVGNPSFDMRAFPALVELPAAAREAEEVAGFYDARCLRTGAAARKSELLREMERAEVIHLALHHVSEPNAPIFSKLLLAAESATGGKANEAAGALAAFEIYRLNLRRARLVVLSACQSWADEYFDGEGAIGISRPFLGNGVPQVVASLWAVDSPSTAELMISFHRIRRTQKLPTAEALRKAQLQMLSEANSPYLHPYHWASFLVVGGASQF